MYGADTVMLKSRCGPIPEQDPALLNWSIFPCLSVGHTELEMIWMRPFDQIHSSLVSVGNLRVPWWSVASKAFLGGSTKAGRNSSFIYFCHYFIIYVLEELVRFFRHKMNRSFPLCWDLVLTHPLSLLPSVFLCVSLTPSHPTLLVFLDAHPLPRLLHHPQLKEGSVC